MNKRSLQLKHVEVFSAVIRSGSVTGASRLLGITQPGVSKIINQTEALCGFSLFERPHGRLIPTPRALRLFDEAERMFVGMEDISRLVERIRQDEPQQALIATVPLFAQELLPQVVSRWLSTNNTNLAITARDGSNVLALVVARRADIGIISAVNRIPGVRSSTIARCRAMCAIPEAHSLSVKSTLTAKDFHDQPYVALSRHEGIQTLIDRVFAREGVKPREVVECPLSLGAIAMACAGVGLTFVDAISVRSFRNKGVVLRRFEPAIVFEYRAIWPDGVKSILDRSAFVHQLREAASEIVAQGEHGASR